MTIISLVGKIILLDIIVRYNRIILYTINLIIFYMLPI